MATGSSIPPLSAHEPWPDDTSSWRHRYISLSTLQAIAAIGAIGSLAVAIWDLAFGGFYFEVLGLRVSSWEAHKPFRNGVAFAAIAVFLRDRRVTAGATSWEQLARWSPMMAAAVAIGSVLVALHFGIFAAGGADAYGYVSEAYLWASGRLVAADPLADLEPLLGQATAPLGYRLANEPGFLAPIYPPGLPMLMAVAAIAAGPSAVYFVVPLLAGLTVWLTYVVGRRVAEPRTALLAATLLAFSPIFVLQSLEPMSDLPATAWWTIAWLFAIASSSWSPLASGLAVSAALLTRPNLVPLTIVLMSVVLRSRPYVQTLARFGLGVMPGCVAIVVLHRYLYGSLGESGYGHVAGMFEWGRFAINLRRYTSWLVELHTPIVLLALAAPLVGGVKHAFWMVAFCVAVLSCYLFYYVFDTWPFVRFLLPALPLLFISCSHVVMQLIARLPGAVRGVAALLVLTLVPLSYTLTARQLTVFEIQHGEYRYVAVGEEIGRTFESNALIVSVIQSGSVRLYGNRPTIRWDFLDPHTFDATLQTLTRKGYVLYLLLEDWEEPLFRKRFDGSSTYGRLDWPPRLIYGSPGTVRVYAPADRARSLNGEPVPTRRITSER
jgi:hypothetical protein